MSHKEPSETTLVIGGAQASWQSGEPLLQARTANYLSGLRTALGEVHFLAVPTSGAHETGYRTKPPEGILVLPLEMPLGSSKTRTKAIWALKAIPDLRRRLAAYRAVVHFFPACGSSAALLTVFSAKRPAILSYFKNDWINHTLKRRRLLRLPLATYWWLMQQVEFHRSDVLVFRDRGHMKSLRRAYTTKVEEAVPILSVEPPPNPGPRARSPSRPVRILYVGGHHREKGLLELLEAFGRVQETLDQPGVELSIVGGGATLPTWLETGLGRTPGRHEVLGYLDKPEELSEQFRKADIFALPSWEEGFPRAIDEAMSYGLAIVATTVGGIPEVLEDGVSALLVPPRDIGRLETSLRMLCTSPQDRHRLGAAARALSQKRIQESAAQQHARLLKQVLATAEERPSHHQ